MQQAINDALGPPRCDPQDHAPSKLYAGYGWCIPDLCYVGYDGHHFPGGWRPAEMRPEPSHGRDCPCEDCCR